MFVTAYSFHRFISTALLTGQNEPIVLCN